MEIREKVAGLSILLNTGLALLKFFLGAVSGSVAITADAIHSSSDIVSSIAVLIGLKISQRKSKYFPYGLYKVENIIAIVSAMAIFFAGYEIVREVLFQPAPPEMSHLPVALIGMVITILATFLFSRYEIRIGKAIGSPSLIADGQHVRTDMLSTIVVIGSLAGQYFGVSLDKPAAIIVSLFIAHAGWEILVGGVKVLLDASLDKDTLNTIHDILVRHQDVTEVKSLLGRNSGSYKFIEAELVMNERDLKRAHAISIQLEQEIKDQIQNVDHVLIHYEPIQKDTTVFATTLDDRDGNVSQEFGAAPFIVLITQHYESGDILEQKILENPYLNKKTGKGIELAEFLVQQGTDCVFTRTHFHGKGPGYVFANAKVRVQYAGLTQLDALVQHITEEHKGGKI
jgi:cation diffusion facilitator family transporter